LIITYQLKQMGFMESNLKIVVVDIDGTVARPGKRLEHLQKSPKDWDAFYQDCFDDTPIVSVCELVGVLANSYEVVYCTGRRNAVRKVTRDWLHENCFIPKPSVLLMRPDGDHRHDLEVKPELLNDWLTYRGKSLSDVAFVLEDRNSMVKHWRSMGLKCLQVEEGDF